ncbi:AAA family ATPase [Spirochaetia bacterium 38H-sp]|uniref:AAA family ATPase n=1 Tax=Rarispira pelagica TaxID=3141764 RepID=A0ABU9UD84_9SPIR
MAPKIIYVTGFRQHAGKTITSLGLLWLLQKKFSPSELGYIKPVGQELITLEDGSKIDKDAIVVKEFSGISDMDLHTVSPVRLGSGFTKNFLDSENKAEQTKELTDKILRSVKKLEDKKVIVAEGTGHPGVGAIVGLSNANVARLTGAEVIFLSGGGLGKALDMLEVDLHYFMSKGVNVKGVIFNKIIPNKIEQIKHYITEDLLNTRFPFFYNPLRILGFLPIEESLSRPSMQLLANKLDSAIVIGNPNEPQWNIPCGKMIIITQDKEHLIPQRYMTEKALYLISAGSGDRINLIIEAHKKENIPIGGFIITCGDTTQLEDKTLTILENNSVPAIYVTADTATIRERIEDVYENPKLQTSDIIKLQKIQNLFEQYFYWDKFCDIMSL